MKKFNIMLLVSIFAISCATSKQNAEKQQAKTEIITNKINNKNFIVDVDFAQPSRGRQIHLTGNYYSLEIRNDSAFVFLPYYGVAYTAPMNASEGGIKFEEPIRDFTINPKKRNNGWLINFSVQNATRSIKVAMDIFTNGTAIINVLDNSRQPISFSGNVREK